MQLPAGVVANAPYEGPAPMLPAINVPLTLTPYHYNPLLEARAARAANATTATSGTSSFSQEASTGAAPQTWRQAGDDSPPAAAGPWALRPTMRNASVLGFTEAQLYQIMGSHDRCEPTSLHNNWYYELRRQAQQVLPHLFLGPSQAARDRSFLQRAGITKVMAIRDSRLAEARLLAVEHVARELGIESECIDVADSSALLRALPAAVQSINQHMLAMPTDADGVSMGKVLVFCETGNVRSPTVVAAYLMSMYGTELPDTLRLVHKARFCISLDEDYKHMLLSFSELLNARRDVAAEEDDIMQDDDDAAQAPEAYSGFVRETTEGWENGTSQDHMEARPRLLAVPRQANASRSRSRPRKRHVGETMDEEDDRIEGADEHVPSREQSAEPGLLNLDMARYQDRGNFAPFTDKSA